MSSSYYPGGLFSPEFSKFTCRLIPWAYGTEQQRTCAFYRHLGASLVAQMAKNPPAIWETWVQSLGWEDHLKKEMATHSSILAWRIPMDRGAWRATVHGVAKSRTQLKRPSTTKHRTAQHRGIWLPRWEEETESQSAAQQSCRLAPPLQGRMGRWEQRGEYY